jgi:hypothetical protein
MRSALTISSGSISTGFDQEKHFSQTSQEKFYCFCPWEELSQTFQVDFYRFLSVRRALSDILGGFYWILSVRRALSDISGEILPEFSVRKEGILMTKEQFKGLISLWMLVLVFELGWLLVGALNFYDVGIMAFIITLIATTLVVGAVSIYVGSKSLD